MFIPWTLPANQAVAINPNIEYSNCSIELNIKFTFKGQQLIGTTYILPIRGKQWLVHIAPDHGMEDYEACKNPPFCPVDEFGDKQMESIKLLEDVKMVPKSAQYRLEQFTLSRSEWYGWWKLEYLYLNSKTYRKGNDTMDNVWFDSDFYLKQTKKRISRQFQIYIWKEVISIMNGIIDISYH
ncbi:isoleucine--tRNA ligase [Rhizophagus irregularis DAOM 181602=DAOM 197198]|nr:isoleucine--tRNA ligase [Rhizophagus irregularis DAOM 181602=DAOM 197198]